MRTGKHHLFRLIVVAGAVLAAAVPTAQAAGPDDRALYRGGSAALAPASVTPDDRPYYRGSTGTLAAKSVVAAKSLGPDDRAFARSRGVEPRTVPAAIAVSPSRFDWEDALVGGTFGLAMAVLGAGAFLIAVRHRRSGLRTA
jgi:hypothetical protein